MSEPLRAACRCAVLRERFGAHAPPRCGVCELNSEHAALRALDLVRVPTEDAGAYRAAGIEVATVLQSRTVWAPYWAATIRETCRAVGLLGGAPILARACTDESFRAAVLSVMALGSRAPATAQSRAAVLEATRAFALSHGLDIPR